MGTGAIRGITDDEVKEDLKINDDALQSIQNEHLKERSLNDFYNARIYNPTTGKSTRPDLDDLWTVDGYRKPKGYQYFAAYSRKAFKYPVLSAYGKFPTGKTGLRNWIGFEAGGCSRLYIAALRQSDTDFYLCCGETPPWFLAKITNLMPSHYDTTNNIYTIAVSESRTELFINRVLRGVGLHCLSEDIPKWENNPPYAIMSVKSPAISVVTTLIEICGPAEEEVILGFGYGSSFMASDGNRCPPRHFAVYTENSSTKWAGSTFSDTVTSHPIPVWGYTKKCFLFQSNAAGTIAIEVYAGGDWREVVSETVTANELWDYVLNLEVPIARMKYTPTNSDTIAVAECNLS